MDELIRQPNSNLNWKVKVFLLNQQGNWDDCGTGTLDIFKEIINGEETDIFQIISCEDINKANPSPVPEEKLKKLKGGRNDERILVLRPFLKTNQFEKQGDFIISWVDKDIEEEIAVSFLDLSTAKEVWRMICLRLGKNPADERKNTYTDLDKLPMPTIENLRQMKSHLESNRDWMICAITKNPIFLEKLFELFRNFEDPESTENLHMIHDMIKIMIFSDDLNFLELLLSDQFYLLVFGALEYDPQQHGPFRPKYRDFLKNHSYYKKVIDFTDPIILKKIHLNFRLSYLRDSVIGSIIDDPLTSQFNTIIYYNNCEIYDHITRNPEYLDQLFNNFFSNLKDSIGFLYELIQIGKVIIQVNIYSFKIIYSKKVQTRELFCEKMAQRNIFSLVAKAFAALENSTNQELENDSTRNILKINLVGILSFVIQSQLNTFIDFLKLSPDAELMINGLMHNLFYGDQGLQIQITEVFKFMTDSSQEKKNEMLDLFYDNILPMFLDHYQHLENNEKFFSYVQQYIELLVHCVKSHGYRIRLYIIQHKLLHTLYRGLNMREKSVGLAIVRLVKNIILHKDEFLLKYITNNNLFDDIFEVYLKNCRKDNLLSSVCLELFSVFYKEKMRKLLFHFVSRFRERIIEYGLQNTFQKQLDAYAQLSHNIVPDDTAEPQLHQIRQVNAGELPENQQELNSRELTCMEDEEYFEAEEEKKRENGNHFEKENSNNRFLLDENAVSDAESISETEFRLAKDQIMRLRNNLHKKNDEEEGDKAKFHANKLSRTSSMDKISSIINIQLNLRGLSESELSRSDYGEDLNVKRMGSDLENDDEIREDGQIEVQKKVKL